MTTARRMQQESASQVVDPLERRLTQALESVPQVTIADDFATRVMRRLPARPNMSFQLPSRASIGRRVALIALALLFVAMFGFALQTDNRNVVVRDAVVWAFAIEFILLTVWVSLRPSQLR